MLDNDHQPPARLMAQMRLAAADLRLPLDMADRLAQRADMTVDRMRQLAPALSMMRTLSVRQGFEADDQAAVLDAFLADVEADPEADAAQIEQSARNAVLNMAASKNPTTRGAQINPPSRVGQSWDHGTGLVERLTDGLQARLDPKHTPTMGRDFAHASLGDIHMELCRSQGLRPRNTAEAVRIQMSQHTTSDFPQITANAISNVIGRGFEQRQPDLARASREVQRDDYHQGRSLTLSSTGVPAEVLQGAEIQFTSLDEKGELLPKIRDFGSGFNISNQALVNDRLDLFSDMADKMLRGALERMRAVLLEPLLANSGAGQNMADGNPLFAVARGNTLAAGTALQIVNLGLTRALMRRQRGSRGELLNIEPWALVVPPELETTAQTVTTEIAATVAGDVNPFGGRLGVICEPGLTSPTAWYLCADPALNDGLTHAFLSGQRTPRVESRIAWETLGMQYRLVWAMDAKFIETASWFRNPGA